jgi:hypothetical protein
VDYVTIYNKHVMPIEVKAGGRGSMQSIRLFMKERGLIKGLRVSLENFAQLDNLDIVPLYAVAQYLRSDVE